jgi:hypothetical protein
MARKMETPEAGPTPSAISCSRPRSKKEIHGEHGRGKEEERETWSTAVES